MQFKLKTKKSYHNLCSPFSKKLSHVSWLVPPKSDWGQTDDQADLLIVLGPLRQQDVAYCRAH